MDEASFHRTVGRADSSAFNFSFITPFTNSSVSSHDFQIISVLHVCFIRNQLVKTLQLTFNLMFGFRYTYDVKGNINHTELGVKGIDMFR